MFKSCITQRYRLILTDVANKTCWCMVPEAIRVAPALFQKKRLVRQALMVYETGRKSELSSHFMFK